MKKTKLYLTIILIILLFTCTSLANDEISANNIIVEENNIDENDLVSALQDEVNNDEILTSNAEASSTTELQEGIYRIYTKLNTNRLIEIPDSNRDAKAYFKIGTKDNTANEKFKITKNSDGTYTIAVLHTLKVMDVEGGSYDKRTKIWQYDSNNTNAQKWIAQANEDGTYTFISKRNNLALDVADGSSAIGTQIQVYTPNGANSQKFILEECANEEGTETIKDGTYKMVSLIDNTSVLEISSGSKKENEELQLWTSSATTQQLFELKYDGEGYYEIKNKETGKVLGVESEKPSTHSKVLQQTDKGLDTQKWVIKEQPNGGYGIASKCGNLYIDVPDYKTGNGKKLQLWSENNTTAQTFNFINTEQVIEDGEYKIYTKLNTNKIVEVPNQSTNKKEYIALGTNTNKANQKFKITYNNEDSTYTIEVLQTSQALDVENGTAKSGTKVWQYTSNETRAQKWYVQENGDGTYTFISLLGHFALDVTGGKTSNGTNIQIYTPNETNSQKFKLEDCTNEKGTQTIEDGTYRILSKINTKKAVTIDGNDVELNEHEKTADRRYTFKYDGEGYYTIINVETGKALAVESENPNIYSKIQLEELTNEDTQKWIVKDQSAGIYSLVSKCGNLYVDIPNSKAETGKELQMYTENDLIAQQFILINEEPKENIVEAKDGIYQIVLTNDRVLDVGGGSYDNRANIQTWSNDKVQQQKFRITRVEGTNYYTITAIHSTKALDVENGDCNIGTNVQQYESNGTSSQQWYFKSCGDGYYNIISRNNGLYLDVQGGVKENTNGQNIQVYYGNGTASQKFKINKIDIINEGTYEIESKLNSNMILDVSNASKSDGGNVQIWQADNVNQQRFILSSKTNEEYSIKAKHSNKVLTVEKNGNVAQYTDKGTDNQRWIIKETGNGYYNLISKVNGKALDVEDGKASNGTNIQTYEINGTNAQAFRFVSGFRKFFEEGSYGTSGLSKKGDKRGTNLKYYKYGKGDKVYFATFSIHGFEDSYDHDGEELTYIANEFKKYLDNNLTESLVNEWTIYIFPNLNPDGQKYGTTNNGPGRTTLYSSAPKHKGIDMNRNWSTGFTKYTDNRNYNGTAAFQAYEAKALRDFLLEHQGKENVLVDLHGWLNETIGDNGIGKYYRNEFGMSKHISTYGRGYLVNWARSNLKNGRSSLVELPEVSKHSQVVSRKYANKYINATIKMLKEI